MKEILDFLEKQREHHHPNQLKKYLDVLGVEIPKEKVLVVAGTNGKGSTCATLQTLLISTGKNVGFFSSPHLMKINERIKFNSEDISDEDFQRIFEIIHRRNFSLSYFEYLTLMAVYYFSEKKVDYAIFEVGLGGTLDATNAIPHDISIITKLGLEHEDILGKGIVSIAKNKLGIVSENNVVFHLKFPDEILPLVNQIQSQKNAKFFEVPTLDYFIEKNEKYPIYWIRTDDGDYRLNLMGQRAVENTSLALEVFEYLVPNRKKSDLQKVSWPCRMEKITYKNRDIFLSGDHNPQGIQSLLEILENFNFDAVHFVVGICFDKDHRQMLESLHSVKNSHIYLTETPEKTLSINNYSGSTRSFSEFSSEDPLSALNTAIEKSSPQDLIIVTGSLYLTGLVKTLISIKK